MASGVTVAIVGVTGAVGQTTLKILEERKFPVKALRVFASERSVGKAITFKGETIRIGKLGPEAFKGVDVALFSAGSAQSREYAPQAVKAGAVVVDKSSAYRMDPAVPLVVPEINAHALRGHQGIVACPNCTTIVTVMPLKPLHDAGRLRRVIATSYQAVSGAGVNGVEELRAQTLQWARGEAMTTKYFPQQIAFNVIPHIDKFLDSGPRHLAHHRARARVHGAFGGGERRDRGRGRTRQGARTLRRLPRPQALGRPGAEPLPHAHLGRGTGRLLRRSRPPGSLPAQRDQLLGSG